MIRPALAILAALGVATSAAASERTGVVAVADPPYGPDADLAELAHQLRAACRDRIGGVEDVPTMRARLLGQTSNATLSELDRAYGGALAVYQNGEFESAVRTLRAIVEDLESIPESDEAYEQWKRALLRLAHAAQTIGLDADVQQALTKLAKTELTIAPDPGQYSPSYRRRLEEVKGKVRSLPKRKLQVVSEGRPGTVYVNGREIGTTPLTIALPTGTYRVGGAAGSLRVPSFTVELDREDRSVVLDFALAESLRVNAGPGLALPVAQRGYGIIRAGAWLGVDRLVVASRMDENGALFLAGSIYDVRRGALLREGAVRMVAGSVPSVNLGALASFLLTGQSSRDVKDRTREAPRGVSPPAPVATKEVSPPRAPVEPPTVSSPAVVPAAAVAAPASPPAERGRPPSPATDVPAPSPPGAVPSRASVSAAPVPPPPSDEAVADARLALPRPSAEPGRERRVAPRWMRPAAISSGGLALALGALAVQQGLSSSSAHDRADAMLGTGGVLRPGSDPSRYRDLRADGDAAARNAYVSAGVAVAFAATAGVLGWRSWGAAAPPALALRF